MVEHVRVLGWIGIARALVGAVLGAWLIWKGSTLGEMAYGKLPVTREILSFDRGTFTVLGWAFVCLAPVRALQGILALRTRPSARRFGLALAVFDAVNLILFPVSTGFGLYGIVVYRHPDTVGYLEARRG
jgi:hypothetical protein